MPPPRRDLMIRARHYWSRTAIGISACTARTADSVFEPDSFRAKCLTHRTSRSALRSCRPKRGRLCWRATFAAAAGRPTSRLLAGEGARLAQAAVSVLSVDECHNLAEIGPRSGRWPSVVSTSIHRASADSRSKAGWPAAGATTSDGAGSGCAPRRGSACQRLRIGSNATSGATAQCKAAPPCRYSRTGPAPQQARSQDLVAVPRPRPT
jgi:hypothetical protein